MHKSAWSDTARAAEEFNDPGKFTTFIGYEFTSSTLVEGGNLHRNVIFNSAKAPIRTLDTSRFVESRRFVDLDGWIKR